MIGKEDGKIPEAITRYIVALYWQPPLLHFESSAFVFSKWQRSHWGVRNQSETSQKPAKRNLSLSLSLAYSLTLLPEPLRLLLFQFPLPLLLLLLLVLLVLLWIFRTVSGPHKFILLPNLKSNAFTHGSLLSLITRLATTLSTTTTPAATAPPLPLVHLGISAFAFKSKWQESRWRVRNQSETSQKPAKRNHLFPALPPSLSLSLPLPFFPKFKLERNIWFRTDSGPRALWLPAQPVYTYG